MTTYLGTALTIVSGMAWNDAVKTTLDKYVKQESESIQGKFIYAMTLTIISVIIIYLIGNIGRSMHGVVPEDTIRMLSEKAAEPVKKTYIPGQTSGQKDVIIQMNIDPRKLNNPGNTL